MATMASTLLRAARNASRAAAMAPRSARVAGMAAAARLDSGVKFPLRRSSCPPTRNVGSMKPRNDDVLCRLNSSSSCADHARSSDDDDDEAIIPTDKDMESDEAVRALYERWCKAFNKKRDRAAEENPEMAARRFKIFKYHAQHVNDMNTYVPDDPMEADIFLRKRREIELLVSKGEDVSHIDDQYALLELYWNADGSDPCFNEHDWDLLKLIQEREEEAHGAVKDAAVE